MTEKEFVPYKPSLRLKAIGFDESCFGLYEGGKIGYSWATSNSIVTPIDCRCNSKFVKNILTEDCCTAPTFSQAFGWLLEEHNLYAIIIPTITMNWTFKTMTVVEGMIEVPPYKHVDAYDYSTRKEAELACLTKLIEIVESKTK